MLIDFEIDGERLVQQPSDLRDIPTQSSIAQLPGGAVTASKRSEGARVVVTWGVEGASAETVAELATLLGTRLAHQISWIDPARGIQVRDVLVQPLETALRADGHYDPLILTFRARPAST